MIVLQEREPLYLPFRTVTGFEKTNKHLEGSSNHDGNSHGCTCWRLPELSPVGAWSLPGQEMVRTAANLGCSPSSQQLAAGLWAPPFSSQGFRCPDEKFESESRVSQTIVKVPPSSGVGGGDLSGCEKDRTVNYNEHQ